MTAPVKPTEDTSVFGSGVPNIAEFEWYWSYSKDRVDLTFDAIFGSKEDFLGWRKNVKKFFWKEVDKIKLGKAEFEAGERRNKSTYEIMAYISDEGGVLVGFPERFDPKKPVIVAVHGHEISARGTLPWELFDIWAGRFVEDGYIVLAPEHLWYDRVGGVRHPEGAAVAEWDDAWHKAVIAVDYPLEWARRADVLIGSLLPHLPAHDGLIVVGLSAGGLSSAILMAMRSDIYAGVFAGSFISLDYLREHYRIKGHPDNWDIRWLNNYATLYALLAPRPVQWQIGRMDPFWPSVDDSLDPDHRFPGLGRRQAADEVWGEFSILRLLWAKFQSSPAFHIHSAGHEVDYSAASEFVKRMAQCKGLPSKCRESQSVVGRD